MSIISKEFRKNFVEKLLSTFISVKVWVLFTIVFGSTFLLMNQYITSGDWTTVMVSSVTVIVISREGFKMSMVNNGKKKNKFECPYLKMGNPYNRDRNEEEEIDMSRNGI